MNKIFKVIWSKSKQCYIVVSEIAKNKTGKKKIIVASILAALAMMGNIASVEGAIPEGNKVDSLGLAIGVYSVSNSNQSVAIGYASSAQAPSASPENPATAVGAGANANGTGAVALGLSANATGANAVALGGGSNGGKNKTEATAANATAVGFNAKASQENAVALGSTANAAALNSIAMGKGASITAPTAGSTLGGQDSIAIGSSASAQQHSSISVGLGATSDGVRSVAIGPKASATDEDTIAIGTGGVGADKNNQAVGANGGGVGSTLVNGVSGVSLYYGAKSSGKQSIAIGYIANAKESGIAIGNYAVSDGGGGTAMGKSVLSRNGGVVVGQSSNAIGKNSVAYGNTVKANGETSTAMGYSATADGQNAVAVGYSNTASNKDSVAIGNTNQSTNQGSVTVGYGNNATNDNAVAIGRSTNASGLLSTAIGNGATSQGTYDVAIGSDVTANGNNSVAIGRNAKTSNTSSLAIGVYGTKGTSATGNYSIAMGRDVTASAESAIAIGKDAVSDKKNAVSIGSGADTSSAATAQSSATIAGKSYSWSKGVLSGADIAGMQVSVGKSGAERQIKNVAAGEVSANSTDAINGSQLYAVASGLAKDLKVPYVSINSTAAGAGSNVDNDGAQGGNSIAIGPSSTVTKQNGIAIGSGAQSLSEDSVVIGRNAKAETKAGAGLTTTSRAIVIGSNSRVAADITQGVAIGSGLSPDEGAVVTGDQSIAIGGNVKVDGHSAIAIGGDDARKAANQLVSYTNKNDAEVTGTLQTAIQELTGYNLTDYKGTTAAHAGVAYGTSALAGNAGVAIGTAANSMTRMNDKGQVVNDKPVTNAVAIGTAARANFDNSVAIGGGSNTDHYATKQVNAIIDGVEVKWSGGENISPGDVVSFGAKGFERQLKNVAPGEVSQTSTDAVNGSQIYSLARKVTNIMNGGSGSVVNVNATGEPLSKVVTGTGASKVEKYYRTVDVKDDGTLVAGAVEQTPTSLALVNIKQTDVNLQTQTPRTLGNVADGVKDNDAVNVSQLNAAKVKYFSVNSTVPGNRDNTGATGVNAIAIGPAATATRAQAIALGNSATAGGTDSIAIGNGSAAADKVAPVAIGQGAQANGDFSVALGGGNHQFVGAIANGVGTTALGSSTKTKVDTNYQTAIGFGASTEAESALAVGYNAAASAQNAIALGRSASTAGQDAVALGSSSQAKGDSGLAIGNGAQANSNSVISLGYQANNGASNNTYGVAIGWAAGMQSNGLNNVGVGTNAGRQVIGNNNTSLGNGAGNIANTKIYTSESIMLGTGAKVVGSSATKSIDNVIAIGKNTSGSASSAIAVGINAGSSAENGVAIGPNSNTSAYNGIALGSFSEASTAAGVSGYNVNTNRTDKYAGLTDIALTSKLGAVSVGNSTMTRQITGVAAGTNDTDAVNIAQLKSVNLAFTGNTGSGDVNLANSKLSVNGDNTYIKTNANGKALTISPNVQTITLNNGRATASTGLADASNVAQAINNVVSGVQLDIIANKGTKTGSVNLSNQKLTVTGGNGIRTDIYSNTSGQNLVIGLEPELVKATTKGIGLTGDTGSTGLKYLKDGDAVFKVYGDGNLVTTAGSATGVKVSVDSTKVKDLAVEAVTVSKANTVDNPITVTSTTSTNSKDYAIGIDTTKLAAKTNLAYTANGAAAKTVSLAKGFNFVNGTNTVATVDSDGKVSFDINKDTKDSISKSATAVGRTITLNADSGTGSSQSLSNGNVSFAVSGATGDYISTTMDGSAVKVSTKRATINSDANTGAASVTGADGLATAKNVASAINSAVNGLSQNLNISDGTNNSSVALKNQKLTVTGTGAAKASVNGQTITIDVAEGTLTPNTTNGTVTGTTGVAKATEVAAAINNTNTVLGNKITKNAQDIATNTSNITANKNQITTNTTNITTNTANIAHTIALADDAGASTTAKSLKDGNVSFNIKGDNKYISTAASGNDVTLTVNEQAIKDAAKSASSFKVKANTHAEEEVKGGDTITFNNGDNIAISQTGKTFTIGTAKNITVDSVTAGNTVINTSGLTNGTTAITGTGITTDKVTVGGISIDKTAGINAGGKVISNVASGTVNNNTTDDSNAANIGDVKQAVANLSQNLNITDGTNNGTVDLKNQKLNVAGANGVTATVNNQTITVGLDANTVNATTKGIGLTADTGSTGNKYLKDGDVSFAVTGDGNLVSTTGTTAGVKVAVDAAKVKDLAVAAVTVSKDAQADNPITVTTTAGANSKDYAIGIDTTKLAAKTDLTYRANSAADANAKKVSLSKGLNFVDGGSTVATVDNDGKVSFDLNTATKNQINTNTTDIAANKGNITKNTAAIATNTAALARNISLGADAGTESSQSLSAADVAFNVKGATGDFVSTNMNGNTVEISTTRATINSNATTGVASVTGNDGLATAQNVADAINKAADAAKAGAAWNITTNSSTTDKTAVKGGDTVDLVNGDNIEITQDGTDKKKITVATKKDITVDSVTANNKVTVGSGANKITLDGTDGSVTGKAFTGTTFTGTSFTGTSFTAGNTVINTNGLTNGTTAITGTGVTTDNVTVGDISIDKTAGINAGNKVISNVASGGTTLTNAANIGDVQNAVANLSQNLNITDGTHDGTVDLKNQKLNVAGANGVTATVNNQTITVGLDANTVNATTKGIGLTADTGSTGNKYLKDGDVSFAVTGDGSLVSTSATAAGVKVAVNSASITAGADGTITGPTTDGVATAKNVADAINAAKKASKTEITANTGEAANATTGNVTLTSTTAADGHTIYDVKLNDKVTLGSGANAVTIDGTTGAITGKTATIGGVTVNGTANTIGGLSNTTWNGTAVSGRAATEDQLKAATGATTLKFTGDVATNTGSVNLKDDIFGIKGDGKYISTDVNGKNVNLTVSEAEVKKSAVAAVTVSTDTTDANNPLTVTPTTSADGTTKDYKVTIDGTKIANKTNLSYKANNGTAKQVSLADGLDFTNGTLTTASIDDKGVVKYDVNTASITAGTDGTITGPTTDGVATAKNVADAINAAKKAAKTEITANAGEAANATTGNVTLTSTTAADGHTIYDVKLNDKVTLGTGANAVTIDGTTGAITGKTATIGGVTVNGTANTIGGLSNTTWNGAAVSGRAATEDQLKAATSATTLKFTGDVAANTGSVNLKDDTFGIKGDGKYISTDVNGKNVNLTVSEAEVKKSAVAAVTVSTDTTDANNPLTVTPTTSADGTTKDYKVTIDGTKIANKTNLSYKANDGTAKQVSLADGLNFKNGTLTTASIDDAGVVKYDVNTAAITAGADGTITGPTTDGVATAKNVADAINAAKKAAKTEITANAGEAANATKGNVTLTSTTAVDGHTIYDVKLNDKVTLGSGANAVTIDGTTGAITGKTATIGGVTVNGTANTIGGLSNTTWNGTATTGRAATEDQLKAVADAAGSQTWEITADKDAATSGAQTGTKKNAKVGKDDKVQLIAGENLTVNQNERDFTYSLNKDLVKMNSATFEATGGKTTVIKGDSIVQTDGTNVNTSNATSNTITDGTNTSTITAGKAQIGTVGIDGVASKISTGGTNAVVVNGADGTIKTGNVTVTGGTTNDITGLSNTTLTATDFATKGRAATEEQLKAVGEQTWQITADKDTATSGVQTGTKKDAKVGKDDKVQLIAGENMTVNQNERDFTFTLNKDLVKMNSATFLGTGSNTTVITGNSITQTAGTQTNTSTAGGNTVADGTKSTETTAAGQVIKDGAKSNKSTVDSNVIDDGTGNVNTSNATSNTITDGTNRSTITAGKAMIGSSIVDGVNNTFTTGGANAVKLDGVAGTIKTGTVTITGGTTNDITGLSNTTVTAADFATKGRAATEEQLKAVGEQTWQITADKDATTSGAQTGTKKDAKVGKDDKVQLIAGENMTVNQNERDFTFTLNKDLVKMNSATFLGTGSNTTVITGNSITQTAGTQTNTSTAGGNTVADGTKSTETTAAGQVIKDGAKSNKSTVDSNVIDDGTGNVNTSNATSNTITDGTNRSTITAGKAMIGSSIVDGVNNTFTTGGANAVKLDGVAGTIKTGTVTITGGTTNDITGLSNTTVTAADFATKGRAATEEQLKAVGEQTWQITADKDATTSGAQTGTKKDAKVGKDDKVQLIAGENMTVNQNERDFTFTLNKDLVKMNSATFEATGGKTTVIKGDSIVQTDGTKVNTSTAGGNTVVDGTKSTATTADGTTVTSANGNTKYAADGVRINTTGKNPVSLTDVGLDNGNNVIKNVASGHVNNDATDNTNAANIADVKKATTTVTANAGEAANATTGNVTLTSTTAVDGHTIYDVKLNDKVTLGTGANAVTIDGTAGKATVGSSVIDGVNNTFTTGGANAVKLDGAAGTIKTGTVTVTGGTTNDITGLSNTTVNSADFATKGRAATEEQLKAVGEQTWQITADKDATTSGAQTGTKKDAKVGKDDKVQLIAGENMTVNQNERDFTFTLNKDLVKMNSATFEATGGKTTVIKGDSIVQTDGTKVNTSTAGGNTVVDGTKSTATTADGTTVTSANGNTKYAADGVRINTTGKNPVSLTDVGLDNGNNVIKNVASGHVNNDATDNTNAANIADVKKATTTVTANAGEAANATKGNVTLTSTTAADGHTIYDVKLNDKVTLGTGANAVTIDGTAGKATVGSSVIDGVNNTFTTGGASPVTLNGATGTITGKTANIGGVTVDGTNNHVMGLANKDWTPGVTQAVSGRAATEDQLQKVSDAVGAGWKINTGKVTGSTGESNGAASTKVASGEEVQFQAGNNLIVDQNGKTVAYSLNKALKDLESATFNGTGTNKTVITGDSITQTAGTQTNTSTAGGNTVADGTKSTETTAAGQVIKDGTKTNTSTVDENTIVDGAKSNKTTVDSNVIDDGTGNVNTSNATSNTITDGTNTTATTSSSVTIKDNAGNSTVITKDNVTTGVGGNKITLDGTAGKATVGSSVVDGVNNTFTTGGTNAVKLDGAAGTVKTGTVTVTGGTTNDITGLSNTTVTSADFATKGRAATEEQLKAVGEQTWQITADKDATTSGAQTGTKKDAKVGKDDKVQLIAGENLTVNQNERDFTYSLNKDLVKMNSATFEATGGKTTVIKGDSIVQTDGTKVNTSTAGGNTVADGTKSTETTAAGQVIKDGAKSNKSTVDNNVIDDGNGNVNTSNATSNTITDGTNTTATTSSSVTVKDNTGNSTVITKDNITTGVGANKITLDGTAGKATIGSSVIDGVNNTFTTGGANAVKLDGAAGTIKTGTVTVTGGTTNDITGLSNTTVTAADFATKGRAATEEQLKAVGEQTWQITADKDTATSGVQTGTKKDAKVGKDDKVQLIAGENMTVNQNERDFTFTLNKDLVKMNSATFLGTGSNTTVITGNSITQTAGTQTNTSTAGGNTVADGTKSTETTAAGQVIKDGAKSNKSTVDNNVIDDGNGNVNTSNATSNTITDGTNTTATTSSSVTVKDNAGNSTVITKDNITTGVGANKITLDGTAGKATIGSSVIDGVNNTFTTGGANAVKLDGAAGTIKTGTVTVTGGTTNDITGLSNTTVNSADFATKGRAATEEQLKAVGEQTWQITADKDATTSGAQTGTKKDAKVGKDDKVQLIAGENLTVNQNERDFTYSLNKDLVKMNSATFEATGGKTTVIKGDSIVQTDGTKVNTSTAGGNTVADGTKSTETTAAGQVIKDGTKSNKSTVDNNVIDDGNGNVNTSNATSNTITDGTNTTATTSSSVTVKDNTGNSTVITKDNITTGVGANKITLDGTAGKATIGSSVIDGVNNTFTTGGANAVKLDGAAGTIKTGTVTVTGGTTNDITGLSNTTVNSADFATKGRAATEEQLKAVGEQTWQITADKDTATSGAQTGTKKDAKVGKDDKVQLIAGENMTVNQNERDFTFTLNKDLVKMNSATFEVTGGKTTVIKGDSIVQTDGTKTNTATASGNAVANGTKSTETTAAGQVIKDGAKTNTSTVDENTIVDGTKSNKSTVDGNTITDGTNTTATTSSSVTVKDNAGNSTVITKDNITTGVGGNKITLDGTAGKATVGASVVDGVNNTFTTGGANAVKLDGVAGTIKTGTVTVTGGTTNDITGLSNTTVNSADFATKGRAATEEQLKAVGEQTWQITADKDATTSGAQTGTKKDAKVGKDDKVQLIAGENMTVNQNERDFTFTLNKDLVKMNSATFLGTGSNTTVITGNSITQTAGTQTNTSTAAGNTIANGTKSTETTADGQVIKDGAKSNKSTVDSNVIDDGNGNKNTSNATSNSITDGTNTSIITAGKANIGNIAVDGVNNKITMGNGATPVTLDGANGHLDGLTNTTWVPGVTKATTGRAATEDQLQQVSDAVGAGWKVNTGTVAGSSGVSNGAASTKVSSGEEVKLQAGDNLVIDQNGKTVSYSLNKDLTKMNSATFEATGGKTTVIKGDSIVQTDGSKTNTSNAAGNTVVDGNKSTATTAAGTTITDGAKTNTSTADKNVIDDGAGNTNVSNATSNTLKNAAGDETKADAKGVTVKDAAGNNATFTKDGITITKTGKDTVSLTSNGLDNGKNKIVNVAAGVANTDAVNVGQLKEYAAKSTTELTANGGQPAGSTTGNIVLTKTTAADGHTIYDNKLNDKITLGTDPTKAVTVDGTTGTVTGLTNKTWTPGSIVSGRAATEDQLKEAVADSGWKAAVDKEGSGQSTVVGTSPEKIKAEETVTFKAGNNMMVTQTGKSISYAVNPELTDMKSATFKDAAGNTTVTNGNGITITPGSANPTNPHAGPVSLTKDGLNNGNNQIKGVAPGTDPTDAVNVSQLNASNANTSQAINQIAGEVQHVGAHAAAMAALKPIQYDPLEPTQVMAGVGNYRGETAAALGLAHYTNENTMFNVGVSVGGNHNMVNAGVTHKFGYSPEKKNIPDRYKAGPISSVYVMQDEVSSLKKENAEQKYVIADQAARLTTLEAENEQQRRELAETKKGLDDLKAAVDKLLASKG